MRNERSITLNGVVSPKCFPSPAFSGGLSSESAGGLIAGGGGHRKVSSQINAVYMRSNDQICFASRSKAMCAVDRSPLVDRDEANFFQRYDFTGL